MATTSVQSPITKRPRNSTSDSLVENDVKIPRFCSVDKNLFVALIRESENVTSDIIKKSITESEQKHFEYIKALIKESEQRIRTLVENEFHDIKEKMSAITERVTNLEIKSTEIVHMKDDILELKRKLLKQENSVIAGGIRISGVPYNEKENLFDIVDTICHNLKTPTPQIENIYRLTKIYKDNKPYTPNDEVIVAKLHFPYEKNFLLKSVSKFRRDNNISTLCLKHAGIDSEQPIYINENLTPHNHRIFKEALSMKKDKKISAAYTLRGLVYIKKVTSGDPILIEFPEDLVKLFRE